MNPVDESTQPDGQAVIRVAQVVMDIRPYRIGFLQRVASRREIALTMYAGRAGPGTGAPDEQPRVAVPVRPIVNRFWPKNPIKVLWQSGALRTLRDDSDVIVVQEVVSNLTVWAIRLLHRRYRKGLVLMGYFYRPDSVGRLERTRSALRRLLRSSAGALVAYSEKGRMELVRSGVDAGRVFVNGNTLDTARLVEIADRVTVSESSAVRQRLSIPDDAVVLGFLGRLRPIKRVDVAIQAMALLRARSDRPHVLLVIGGGEEEERLRALADPDHTRFVGQTYDEVEIARLFSLCSMLVLPGSVGLTCVHGFASGLPCITTSDAATIQTPEFAYVEHERNGLIMASPDPDLYAKAIAELSSDPQRLTALRAGARQAARALDMERMVDAFVAAVRLARQG